MNINEFKGWFNSLDKENPEFQLVYELVYEAYWDIPDHKVDEYIKCAKMLNKMSSSQGLEEVVIATAKIAEQVFKCVHTKSTVAHGSIGLSDKEYHFDIYTDKSELSNLSKMMRNTVIVQHEKGQADG